MSKPKRFVELPRGHYAIHVLGEDCVRLDLLDSCIPAATGDLVDGWGSCFLSTSQVFELVKALTSAAVKARPRPEQPKKLGRPKK